MKLRVGGKVSMYLLSVQRTLSGYWHAVDQVSIHTKYSRYRTMFTLRISFALPTVPGKVVQKINITEIQFNKWVSVL